MSARERSVIWKSGSVRVAIFAKPLLDARYKSSFKTGKQRSIGGFKKLQQSRIIGREEAYKWIEAPVSERVIKGVVKTQRENLYKRVKKQ